jgi:acetyltransferase (GNAT) family protein
MNPQSINRLICQNYVSEKQNVGSNSYYKFVYGYLTEAKKYYPDFEKWFFNIVVPEVEVGDRHLLIETRDDYVAGIAIVKAIDEKKLCTLRVVDRFQGTGLGIRLFERCFEALETDSPFLTISEEKLPAFQRIFDYYGFEMTSIKSDVYRKGKKEYFFNER